MKKKNKKLSITAESIRALTTDQLTGVAGGVPNSKLGSGCLGCGYTDDCPSVLPTACPSQCWFC